MCVFATAATHPPFLKSPKAPYPRCGGRGGSVPWWVDRAIRWLMKRFQRRLEEGAGGRTDRKGTGDGGVWGGARRLCSGGVKETGSCSLRGEALIHNSPPRRTFIHILTPPPTHRTALLWLSGAPRRPLHLRPSLNGHPTLSPPWRDAPLSRTPLFLKKSFSLLETVEARKKKNPRILLSNTPPFIFYFIFWESELLFCPHPPISDEELNCAN